MWMAPSTGPGPEVKSDDKATILKQVSDCLNLKCFSWIVTIPHQC